MKYTVTFPEHTYNDLVDHLFSDRSVERAAYALGRLSVGADETRMLIRQIIPVVQADIEEATPVSMKIKSVSFIRAMKIADQTKQTFIFIHSHPKGIAKHSSQDNREELSLFRTAYNRIEGDRIHASLVLSMPDKPVGRVWLKDGTTRPISVMRVIGNRFKFYTDLESVNALPIFFDRQIRAFGEDIQKLLRVLNIGIIGTGGTGSAISEQLIRLGVGTLSICDGETFDETNVNRVYGSFTTDSGLQKISIIKRLSNQLGLQTKIISFNKPISFQSVVNAIKQCDIIFCCTDDQWGRSILNKIAVYYQIPVFDMGVSIDSEQGIIKSVQGRVTTLLSKFACLFCRERIDPKNVESESFEALDPKYVKELREEGYIPELEETAPAVIPFTTNIASLAIMEMLHRLTGFMGENRESNEIIVRFDETEIRKNRRESKSECFCGDSYYALRGDTQPLLDITWRPEHEDQKNI